MDYQKSKTNTIIINNPVEYTYEDIDKQITNLNDCITRSKEACDSQCELWTSQIADWEELLKQLEKPVESKVNPSIIADDLSTNTTVDEPTAPQ